MRRYGAWYADSPSRCLVCGLALMGYLDIFDARILAQNLIIGADNFALMAIPFFILVGELMNAGGISRKIINFGIALVGHIRGGLGYVAIFTAFIFAGLSGSAVADTAALAAIMVPMMAEAGYDKSRSAALIGAGSIVATDFATKYSIHYFWFYQWCVCNETIHGWLSSWRYCCRKSCNYLVVYGKKAECQGLFT